MKVNIEIFEHLNTVAQEHNVACQDGAKASGVKQPRISELLRLSRLKKGDVHDPRKVGRACTVEKLSALMCGLYVLLEDRMHEAMNTEVDKQKDGGVWMLMLAMWVASNGSEQDKQMAEALLKKMICESLNWTR